MIFFLNMMTMIFDALKTEFTLWGFTFSLWNVFLVTFISALLIKAIARFFE